MNKVLLMGAPTIAAINGHAIAAGFIFALACDFRFMRNDFGNVSLPEINLGVLIPL